MPFGPPGTTSPLRLFADFDYLALPSAQLFPFPIEQAWPAEVGGRAMDSYHRWMEVVCRGRCRAVPSSASPPASAERGLPMGSS